MGRFRFRLLDTGPGDPALNMAVDEVLLRGAERRPTVRFYAWQPPAISLGYSQRIAEAVLPPGVVAVRRITGGGAILHRDELTYSVAAPVEVLGGIRETYRRIHAGIRAGLAAVGVAVRTGEEPEVPERGSPEPFYCYERRSTYDLLVGRLKLVGSAQRREARSVLQHGSIPLGPEPNAPGGTTVSAAAGRAVSYDELARALGACIGRSLGAELDPGELDPEEAAIARRLACERYGAESWTRLR